MASPITCLVPLRSPGEGKTRMAPDLTVDQRAALAGAMLADVVTALRAVPIDRVVVAAAGPAAAAAASALGLEVLVDAPGVRGLDAAITAAAARLRPLDDLLVVQADLPRLRAEDVHEVVAGDDQVVIAPTSDGGTSALLRRPHTVVGTAYGRDSAAAHRRAAVAAGVVPRLVDRPGLATDVDTYADLQQLDPSDLGAATSAVLRGIPNVRRLGA